MEKRVNQSGRGIRLALVLIAAASAVLLASCGPPPSFLEPLFPEAMDPANASKPYVRRARREMPKKEAAPVVADAVVLPPRPDVGAIYATLPRNDEGQVLWLTALADKLIAPKPGTASDAKDDEPTDIDVELAPKGQPEFKVIFSHKVHTSWLVCDNCHTGLFEMEKGKTVITMDKINAGQSCGVCHGKVAAPEPSGCPACHEAMGK
jgi:c(7)-type cytochrome triheme protein